MANIFDQYPITVDILSPSLYLKKRIFFVGNVPKNSRKLDMTESIKGGDDLFDITELHPSIEKIKKMKAVKPPKISKEHEGLEGVKKAEMIISEDIILYPEDRISELRKKLM